jgi:PAS domain S-box-containing protein
MSEPNNHGNHPPESNGDGFFPSLTKLLARSVPPAAKDQNHPDYWQERILFALVASGVFFAPWVLAPTLVMIASHGHWPLFVVDSLAYCGGVYMLLFPSTPYRIRAGFCSLILYSIGITVIWSFGPYIGMKSWLFAFAVTAALLLGRPGALAALILNALTFLVVGRLGAAGMWEVFPQLEGPVDHWTVVTVNFMLLNVFTVVCISEVVNGLKISRRRAEEAIQGLAAERKELIVSKRLLENEVEERKLAEQSARRNELMYRELLKAIPDAVVVYDADGRVTYVNDAFINTYGWARDDLLGRAIDFVPPEEAAKTANAWDEQLRTNGAGHFSTRRLTKEGEVLDVEARGSNIHDPDGQYAGAIVVHRNVTAQRKAERALKENERRLQAILQASPDPVVVYDNQGCTTYINPAFTQVFGWTMEEVAGRRIPFVPPEEMARVKSILAEMYQHGNPVGFESRRLTKDGEVVDVFIGAATIKNQEGAVTGIVVNLTDIGEVKRLEEQLRQSQKMEAIGTLAGGIAHDFNNLLQAITGYAQLLTPRLDDDQTSQMYLEEIGRAAQRASELVRSLLTFGRKVEPRLVPVDLNEVVTQTIRILERTLPRMIIIHTDLADSLGLISGDPNQIELMLLNLGANAGDAMPEGGQLTISTGNLTVEPDVPAGSEQPSPGEYVWVRVADTGQGIDPRDQENIFDPFFTTKEIGKGTGLGLSTAYGIVHKHGGFITCESQLGQGTVFNIFFPHLTEGANRAVLALAENGEAPGGDETILLVDDESTILTMGREALSEHGYGVLAAERGEEALEIYREQGQEISLVVLDLGMPGMGGDKCLEELLKIDPELKVLIASGYTAASQVRAVRETGAAGFIAKPYRLKDLLKLVRKILDKS